MKRTTKKIIIQDIALVGIITNVFYGVELLQKFFDPQTNEASRDILISAITLEFTWAALLAWLLLKPFERRHILLFTAISMLLGNILHSLQQFLYMESGVMQIVLNLSIGIVFSGLFVFAYYLGNSDY